MLMYIYSKRSLTIPYAHIDIHTRVYIRREKWENYGIDFSIYYIYAVHDYTRIRNRFI